MENEKLRIINYPFSIFHFPLPSAIIDFPPHCELDPQSAVECSFYTFFSLFREREGTFRAP